MNSSIDEVVHATITQTGRIEDIIKTAIGQATQALRSENATLKIDRSNAHAKIAWLEDLVQHEERSKIRALQEQRQHYLQIGGPEFHRVVREEEMQQAKDVHEIASLEAQYLGNRNQDPGFRYGWNNEQYHPIPSVTTQSVRSNLAFLQAAYDAPASPQIQVGTSYTHARSLTTVVPHISPPGLPVPDSPTPRARASTLIGPGSRPLGPIVGSPVLNAGSAKPPITSLAVAPAPQVCGLRNAQGRYDSPIICAKCHKIFAFNSWNPDHYKNCKGKDEAASPAFGRHIMPNLPAGHSHNGLERPEKNHSTIAHPDLSPSSLPFCTASHSSKSDGTNSVQQ